MGNYDQVVKASDLVISKLVDAGVDTFFGVTGGAAVHLFDSVDKHDEANLLFFNHEQSASFAVEAYAKIKKGLGAGIFTTGPGATNAITGLAAAWLDSTPCIFVSGQSRVNSTISGRKIRQVGTQEIDIVSVVKPITKYAVMVRDINELSYHIDYAIFLSQHGRKGPCWIDIPVDITWSELDLNSQKYFCPPIEKQDHTETRNTHQAPVIIADYLNNAKRPLVLVGQGVRSAGIENELLDYLKKLKLHFVVTWAMCDFCETDEPLYLGQLGISGQRGANMAVQNADTLVCFGTHLNNSITGTNYELFAKAAKKIVISNDPDELDAIKVKTEHRFCADLLTVVGTLISNNSIELSGSYDDKWNSHCRMYKSLNSFSTKFSDASNPISSYYLKEFISRKAPKNAIFVTDGGGTNVYSSHQSICISDDQRMILSEGLCSMGSGLPEAIGAIFASQNRPVICFIGDGSFPFNVQELQVVKNLNLDIKIFVLNNNGYSSIKTTQQDFLNNNFIGSDVGKNNKNVHTLNVRKIALAFEIPYRKISKNSDLHKLDNKLSISMGPMIIEVIIDKQEIVEPRQGFKPDGKGGYAPQPLHDMYPFLDKNLLNKLLIKDTE